MLIHLIPRFVEYLVKLAIIRLHEREFFTATAFVGVAVTRNVLRRYIDTHNGLLFRTLLPPTNFEVPTQPTLLLERFHFILVRHNFLAVSLEQTQCSMEASKKSMELEPGLKQKIDQFFQAYEKRFMDGLDGKVDVEGTTKAFATCFMEASPAGVVCGQNDAKFHEAIPKGYEFYKSVGTTSMKITSKETTPLDDFHIVCKVSWSSSYKKGTQEEVIDFDVFYFLQNLHGDLKIFGYVTGDEQKALKDRGLI